jgi:hypothetical protein
MIGVDQLKNHYHAACEPHALVRSHAGSRETCAAPASLVGSTLCR